MWADLAAQALEGYQALYVHIKGPDVPAHDGRAEDKRDVIEAIDRAFFGEVLPRLDLGRTVVGVLADHATSCVRKAHTADPVPARARRRCVHVRREHVLRRGRVRRRLARAAPGGRRAARSYGTRCGDGVKPGVPRVAYTKLSGPAPCHTLAASMTGMRLTA